MPQQSTQVESLKEFLLSNSNSDLLSYLEIVALFLKGPNTSLQKLHELLNQKSNRM